MTEIIDGLISSDLAEVSPRLTRHHLVVGKAATGSDVQLAPHEGVLLIAGPSGSGKTTVTTTFLEQLCNAGYQFCVFDPEGDYHEFPGAIALRGNDARALVDEALSSSVRKAC